MHVGDRAASSLDDERSSGVVPDALRVVGAGTGQAQVNLGVAPGHDGVLALTVDAEGLFGNAEALAGSGGQAAGAVRGDERLGETALGRVRRVAGVDGPRLGTVVRVHGQLRRAFVPFGKEDLPSRFGVVKVQVRREVRAPQRGHLRRAVHHERQGDGILVAPHEALGAVDRVHRPVAIRVVAGGAVVDPLEDIFGRGVGVPGAHLIDDARSDRRVLIGLEGGGVLFANDGVVRKGGAQGLAHERLASEVGDGDGRTVVLFEHVAVHRGADGLAEGGGGPDGLEGHRSFAVVGVGHGEGRLSEKMEKSNVVGRGEDVQGPRRVRRGFAGAAYRACSRRSA